MVIHQQETGENHVRFIRNPIIGLLRNNPAGNSQDANPLTTPFSILFLDPLQMTFVQLYRFLAIKNMRGNRQHALNGAFCEQ
ncbi:hypothetical protein SDC9_169436 [bioreactor metagenome]|uniref:Uncharacterized protein n=1 Tax=bioreactor metagenome TaxID=1076179 RepID=A0A645GE13_9ZZZZ